MDYRVKSVYDTDRLTSLTNSTEVFKLNLENISKQSNCKMSANNSEVDDIYLGELVLLKMGKLCIKEDFSDVTFIVENQTVPAHRVILAARSEYFRALLFGGFTESTQSVINLNVPVDAFKSLLRYLYCGHLPFTQMAVNVILDTFSLADQFGVSELALPISDYLANNLALTNVCAILDAARFYNLDELTKDCLQFMDRNSENILQHESFTNLSKESLEEVLKRDSFFAPEVQIFLTVQKWCKQNENIDIQSFLSLVRFPLMNLEQLLQIVRPTGILECKELLDAMHEQIISKNLPFRASLRTEENVATSKFGSRTIQGNRPAELLNGNASSYIENCFTHHCITDANDSGITVELGTPYIINRITVLLWDRYDRSYSYFIEVSMNQKQWDRVIDYSPYLCRSWQFLYFQPRPVRYIKLVGTHCTVNKVFHVVALEAMYIINFPKVIEGLVVPTDNVSTIEMGAVVADGKSNDLINGNYTDYDWDWGYTSHQLDSGEILVRLAQPYIIGSMSLLLWDLDDRHYSFYIETSVNKKDWVMVVDKRNETVRCWQNVAFIPLPVLFIRIVGTRNTVNEDFRCVYLECPSQDLDFKQRDGAEEKEECL